VQTLVLLKQSILIHLHWFVQYKNLEVLPLIFLSNYILLSVMGLCHCNEPKILQWYTLPGSYLYLPMNPDLINQVFKIFWNSSVDLDILSIWLFLFFLGKLGIQWIFFLVVAFHGYVYEKLIHDLFHPKINLKHWISFLECWTRIFLVQLYWLYHWCVN
jgi:hypothetical protein